LGPRAIAVELSNAISATRKKGQALVEAKETVYHTPVACEVQADGYTLSVYCWTEVCCWLGEKPTV